jgi:hypothetical protein
LIFHIESGSYDGMTLDGLNVALAVHTPGPMGEEIGRWLPTSINAPAISRLKHWVRSSPAWPAAHGAVGAADCQEPCGE